MTNHTPIKPTSRTAQKAQVINIMDRILHSLELPSSFSLLPGHAQVSTTIEWRWGIPLTKNRKKAMVQIGEFAGDSFHAAIGRAQMRWRLIDTMLFRAFVDLLSPLDAKLCELLWHSHQHHGQVKLVDTLVLATVDDKETLATWKVIKLDLQKATELRNRIAHSDTAFIVQTIDDGARSSEKSPAVKYVMSDPQKRSSVPHLSEQEIQAAGESFQMIANRIDGLLSPTPLLRPSKPHAASTC